MACSTCGGDPPSNQQCTRCGAGEQRMPRIPKAANERYGFHESSGGCAVTGVALFGALAAIGVELARWLA